MADPADLIDIQKRSVMKAKNLPVPAIVGKISCSKEMLGLASSFAFNSAEKIIKYKFRKYSDTPK